MSDHEVDELIEVIDDQGRAISTPELHCLLVDVLDAGLARLISGMVEDAHRRLIELGG
jgi:hypothetical protein